jgi:hypothetical protein
LILENLIRRQQNASFLKDPDLYQRKVIKLEAYIESTKKLIQNNDGNQDIDSAIRSLLIHINNDPDIYTNTSRFFKRTSNVTVLREINELYEYKVCNLILCHKFVSTYDIRL